MTIAEGDVAQLQCTIRIFNRVRVLNAGITCKLINCMAHHIIKSREIRPNSLDFSNQFRQLCDWRHKPN